MKQRRSIFQLIVVVALLAPSVPANAQLPPIYTVSGSVTDALDRPLSQVNVTDDRGGSDVTDGNGRYDLPQGDLGEVNITVSRSDLQSRTDKVEVLVPTDTTHNFESVLYRLYLSISSTYATTASQTGSIVADIASWAPLPGQPGNPGASCVKVADSLTGTTGSAVNIGQNPDGSYAWRYTHTLNQNSAEGIYSLAAKAESCDTAITLTRTSTLPYVVDNTPPQITDISPRDGHNTIFAQQPIQAAVSDVGPSGIVLGGVTFSVKNETETGSQPITLQTNYNATSGVASSTIALSTDLSEDYTVLVTARDRAGNAATLGHAPYRGRTDPTSGGFRRVSLNPTSAITTISQVVCPVSPHPEDPTKRLAVCPGVNLTLSNATVSVNDSRHSYDQAFLVHTAALSDAVIERDLVTGEAETANAYAHRDLSDGGWGPRTIEFRYATGDKLDLPSTKTASPDTPTVPLGSLRIILPFTWVTDTSVKLKMTSTTSFIDTQFSVPATSACPTPLTSATPCDTDPVWSRFSVILDKNRGDLPVVVQQHQSSGAEVLFDHSGFEYLPFYEAILAPRARSAIRSDSAVVGIVPKRQKNLEDRYFELTAEAPVLGPTVTSEELFWTHAEHNFSQRIAMSPNNWSILRRSINDASFPDPPSGLPGPSGETPSHTPPSDETLSVRPLASLLQGNPGADNRTVRYNSSSGSYWIEAQPVRDQGIRLLIQLLDATAPTIYDFSLDFPDGHYLQPAYKDGAVVLREGHDGPDLPIWTIRPPFAFDADGRKVPVRQYFEADTIRVSLDLSGSYRFPILVDPTGGNVAIDCNYNTTNDATFMYLEDTGTCPYGVTFLWAFQYRFENPPGHYWPEKARVGPGGPYRTVRLGGDDCSWGPEATPWWDFTVPCQMHDYGYDLDRVKSDFHYDQVNQDTVDSEFKEAMLEHCATRYPLDQEPCTEGANAYYALVKRFADNPNSDPWPRGAWPDMQFLRNRSFDPSMLFWEKGVWYPGQAVSWGTYPTGYGDYWLEFECNSIGTCSVYQDMDIDMSLRGGEYLQGKLQLACQDESDWSCDYGFSVWAWPAAGGDPEQIHDYDFHVSAWNWYTYPLWVPLDKQYKKVRFEIYNHEPWHWIGVYAPSFTLYES